MTSPPSAATATATIVRLLAEMTGHEPASLTGDTRIFMELGLTSSRILELLMRLEDEFDLRIVGHVDWLHMETVDDLAVAVADRSAGLAPRS
ncbi:acyl carrier protein [Micromonospora sp. HUAS LYJ1]|uniref:acyl carrier protein n=1 Tax=Micromonospora sp. HUAS LYJ1 TaxID=3061626 RepID=UPI0026733708|nr:acyl carrier protein [Micromonospora sp. HUAS LYJ1]WKU07207.1 acyl carrier protein [Micromonospora sp. HUAS LYJ1]